MYAVDSLLLIINYSLHSTDQYGTTKCNINKSNRVSPTLMCTAGVKLFFHYLCMTVYYFLYVCMYF